MHQMKCVQRAFTYISRKKGKTASLFLLIFVIAVFLISCFRILYASERLEKDIRTSLGAAFYIRANTEVSINDNGETEIKENHIHITEKEINEITQIDEIQYCNPINYGFAKSDAIQFIQGDRHTEDNNMGKVTALCFSALAPDFTDETAVLTKGKHITETDCRKILISEQLADTNHLTVGDSLTLTHAGLCESDSAYIDTIPIKSAYVEVEVSGIYKLNSKNAAIRPTAGLAENEIYASLDILNALHESETGIYTGEVAFYITDPARLNTITGNVMLMQSIDWTTHFIRTNDFQYSKIADRLSSLGNLVKILLVLVSVVSAAILTLLLTMRMRGRMQEAGILLSVGISKGQILTGFLLEILSVTVIALILSYIISFGVTNLLGNRLFCDLPPKLLNDELLIQRGNCSIQMKNYLKLGGTITLLIYLCQFIVITASTFVSSIMIMRLRPKEILSKMQ